MALRLRSFATPSMPLALALLAVATCAAFAGVIANGWVLFDDPQYVFANPHMTGGLTIENARWFLVHAHDGNWDPLPSWSHLLDVEQPTESSVDLSTLIQFVAADIASMRAVTMRMATGRTSPADAEFVGVTFRHCPA